MKINLNYKDTSSIEIGDLVKTDEGYFWVVGTNDEAYAFMNLKGKIETSFYGKIEYLVNGYDIKKIIKNDELELKLINN